MSPHSNTLIRTELQDRRDRLEHALRHRDAPDAQLHRLLHEVDAALLRLDEGTFGLCETCHDPIEADRLAANPLLCHCLDHLTEPERRSLENDLQMAWQIQSSLLPRRALRVGPWDTYYHYERAGAVSGDYCDIIPVGETAFLLVGDACGKGVAASMLMSQLHALFRALTPTCPHPGELLERVNHLICGTGLPSRYATVVCARAEAGGTIELASAGHCPPLWLRDGEVVSLESTGIPLGMFCDSRYGTHRLQLAAGDGLLLYTDGLFEAANPAAVEYGLGRLATLAGNLRSLLPEQAVTACLADLKEFRAGAAAADDLTILAVQRSAAAGGSVAA